LPEKAEGFTKRPSCPDKIWLAPRLASEHSVSSTGQAFEQPRCPLNY